MLEFTINEIEELVDGRLYCKWTTVADDGNVLKEGIYLTPDDGESLEDCLERCIAERKAKREEINNKPKKNKPKRHRPARKQTTRMLDDTAINDLKRRLSND